MDLKARAYVPQSDSLYGSVTFSESTHISHMPKDSVDTVSHPPIPKYPVAHQQFKSMQSGDFSLKMGSTDFASQSNIQHNFGFGDSTAFYSEFNIPDQTSEDRSLSPSHRKTVSNLNEPSFEAFAPKPNPTIIHEKDTGEEESQKDGIGLFEEKGAKEYEQMIHGIIDEPIEAEKRMNKDSQSHIKSFSESNVLKPQAEAEAPVGLFQSDALNLSKENITKD